MFTAAEVQKYQVWKAMAEEEVAAVAKLAADTTAGNTAGTVADTGALGSIDAELVDNPAPVLDGSQVGPDTFTQDLAGG